MILKKPMLMMKKSKLRLENRDLIDISNLGLRKLKLKLKNS